MAGMGPPPKDPRLRQRKNKTSTAATLKMPIVGSSAIEPEKRPELPVRGPNEKPWHPETVHYWNAVWASPMAAEYIAADIPGLVAVFKLQDEFNYGTYQNAAEIRLQRQCFGLTPLDRRRLQWEIQRAEEAERRRPSTSQAPAAVSASKDPRRLLRAVK